MANLQFEHSSAQLRTVQEIQFGLLSPEEIKNMSVVHVEYPETMVGFHIPFFASFGMSLIFLQDEQRQKPREKGLNDPKLGSIDRYTSCGTCGEIGAVCPGHWGHIELAVPVFHIGLSHWPESRWDISC